MTSRASVPTISDAELISRIAAALDEAVTENPSLGGSVKYVYPDGNVIFVDGRKIPHEVHRRNEPADCDIYFSPEIHWATLEAPELQHIEPFQKGKVRIVGNLAMGMKIGQIIRENRLKILGHKR